MSRPPAWRTMAYFDQDTCVATAQTCDLHLATSGGRVEAGGIRLVGVAVTRRGQGLFRDLIEHALRQFASRAIHLVLLFTEDPELYRRFGFDVVPQHAFTGRPPEAIAGGPAQILDAIRDLRLIERLLARRTPVSGQIALIEAPALVLDKVHGDDELKLAFVPDLETLMVCEEADDALTIVDVVAADMPPLARLIGALPRRFVRVTTLFPPDRLAWTTASPISDDTGLMARGPLPAAMRRPFMLPPTAEF